MNQPVNNKMNSMLKEVKVDEAVGLILAHDLTQIIPGKFKGRLFAKGHVIREDDIEALRSIGKEHIYTIKLEPGYIHEDEAALRMAVAVRGDYLELSEPYEGKVNLTATIHGLAKIDKAFVDQINAYDEAILSTRQNNTVVTSGQALAGTRTIPLIVEEETVMRVERLARQYKQEHEGRAPLRVLPFRPLRIGLITTGSEVYSGRIADKFGPIIRQKLAEYESEVIEQRIASDDSEMIVNYIQYFLDIEVDLILVTGGMSVDPDDRTPGAIKRSGARIVSYGTPMLPGSMLMMAYLRKADREVPIMGLPGCVMHDPFTSFDVLLPQICAGEIVTRADIVVLGYGGMHSC